jgi:anti-sigma factor RsiW
MTMRDHDDYIDNIGPYVLGALPELEAELLERHLATCETCSAEVARLESVSFALARSVPQVEPPPSLKASLMRTVREEAALRAVAEGRRPGDDAAGWRARLPGWLGAVPARFALAGALAVLAIGVVIGVAAEKSSQGPAARTITAQVDRSLMPAGRATLSVSSEDRVATIHLAGAPRPASGRVYQLWVQRGKMIVRGPVFTVDRSGNGSKTVPGGVHGADAVMVTVERGPDGAPAPTGPPIIRFAI